MELNRDNAKRWRGAIGELIGLAAVGVEGAGAEEAEAQTS